MLSAFILATILVFTLFRRCFDQTGKLEFVESLLSTFNAVVSTTSRFISTIYFMFDSIYNHFIICSKFIRKSVIFTIFSNRLLCF